MNEIFAPFLLIILGWNDLDPSATMKSSQAVFIDEQTCQLAGQQRMQWIEADRLKRLEKTKVEQVRTEKAKFLCVRHQSHIQKFHPLTDSK